jgi:hypothetical protein
LKTLAIILVLAGLICAVLAGLSAVEIMPSLVANGVFSIGGENLLGEVATSAIIWGGLSSLLMMLSITFAVLSTRLI